MTKPTLEIFSRDDKFYWRETIPEGIAYPCRESNPFSSEIEALGDYFLSKFTDVFFELKCEIDGIKTHCSAAEPTGPRLETIPNITPGIPGVPALQWFAYPENKPQKSGRYVVRHCDTFGALDYSEKWDLWNHFDHTDPATQDWSIKRITAFAVELAPADSE